MNFTVELPKTSHGKSTDYVLRLSHTPIIEILE
jgi:hypothetical protein